MSFRRRDALRTMGAAGTGLVAALAGCLSDSSSDDESEEDDGTDAEGDGGTDTEVQEILTPSPAVESPSDETNEFGEIVEINATITNQGSAGPIISGFYWTAEETDETPPLSELTEEEIKEHTVAEGETIEVGYDTSDIDEITNYRVPTNTAGGTVVIVNNGENGASEITVEQGGSVVQTKEVEFDADQRKEVPISFEQTLEDFEYAVTVRDGISN